MSHRALVARHEVAGQLALSALGLRLAGVPATAFSQRHRFHYGVGPDVELRRGRWGPLAQAARLVATHDVVHFFVATSFLPDYARFADARLLRRLKRGRVLVTFCGSEVRRPSIESARNRHYVRFEGEDDATAEARLRRWSAITGGHAVVQDPALVVHVEDHFAHPHVLPVMVDTTRYDPRPPDPAVRRPVIVHSPTDHEGKGTPHVRRAVAELERRGLRFEYREVTGVAQPEALRIYAEADLVIDQLCCGSHGVFAVEAMSMAKPVLCHVAPDRHRFPADLPIIQADTETVTDVLHEWLERPEDRRELGLRGRAYAEGRHDVRVVGAELAALYGRLYG